MVKLIKNHDHENEGYVLALGGRPEEEGGHRAWKLSFDKLTTEACEKVRKGGGNVSEWIEKQLKSEIENLDPGDASAEIWRYETYLNQRISEALIEDNPGKAKALTSILVALKDFRSLCGIAPLNPELLSTEVTLTWKKQAFEDFIKIRNVVVNDDPDDLVQVPEAILRCIETYPFLNDNLKAKKTNLKSLIERSIPTRPTDFFSMVEQRYSLIRIAKGDVPKILEKVFRLLHES